MIEKRSDVLLQPRDINVLRDLFECRVMSLAHVTALHFEGKKEAAKKRVQKLKDAGLIRERPRAIGEPSLLHLTKGGFQRLRDAGQISRFPNIGVSAFEKRSQVSEATLRHELEVMDVRVALVKALFERPALSIAEFSTWPTLNQFTAIHESSAVGRKEIVVKPDGFLRIREAAEDGTYEHMFFIEVDRSTESLEVLAQKAFCYLHFYQQGGMALRFGARREEFRDFPFRVLAVFQSEERRNNVAERLLRNNPPLMTQVWLSTMAEIRENPLSPIWIRPKDYAETMGANASHHLHANENTIYRRNVLRDLKARDTVPKSVLL